MSIPNPLHPLLPPLTAGGIPATWTVGPNTMPQMASDGQVEEKPASGPRPIETLREWEHTGPRPGREYCNRTGQKVYRSVDAIPEEPCGSCGDDYISRGVVERDVETGEVYRRDGKAVPREKS